jgi:AraC-like DNA-binding protein
MDIPTKPSIPLIRLSLLMPFVHELDRRGLDTNAVLAANGLVRATVADSGIFVPQIVIHRFLEDAAVAANDPYLAVAVGESLDWSAWSPVFEAAARARNLVGFLVRFVRAAADESSSARHELLVGPEFASFRERRTTEQEIEPAQNDAFTAAYTLSLLRSAAGPAWNAEQVRITVCDPTALPNRYMGVHILGGDSWGIKVRFPSAWLMEKFHRESFMESNPNGKSADGIPRHFLESLRHVVMPFLHEPDLQLGSIAARLGVSPQSLQRKLRAGGTTFSEMLQDAKKEKAMEQLLQTHRSIGDISAELGFSNPNSFSRAFKKWVGQSPREYRKQHES